MENLEKVLNRKSVIAQQEIKIIPMLSPEELATLLAWYKKMKFMNTIIDMSFYVVPSVLGASALGLSGYLIYNTAQGLVNTAIDVFKFVSAVGISGALGSIGALWSSASLKEGIKEGARAVATTIGSRLGIPHPVFKPHKTSSKSDSKPHKPDDTPPSGGGGTPPPTPPPAPPAVAVRGDEVAEKEKPAVITFDHRKEEYIEVLKQVNTLSVEEVLELRKQEILKKGKELR